MSLAGSAAPLSGTPDDDDAVADFLQILEEHRCNCERQGKYVEAEIAKNRLEELRAHEEQRRREALQARQHAERVGVEESHELEWQQVSALWDRKVEEYEANALALQNQLQRRQEEEAAELREKFQHDPARKPRFSAQLLNLRRIEQTLARAQNYTEAHKVKAKADNMELWELERMKGEVSKKFASREAQLVSRHENEMRALAKRIASGRQMQEQQREADLRRLLLRFKNLKADLLAQQSIERQRLEKLLVANRRSVGKGGRKPNGTAGASNTSANSQSPSATRSGANSARGKGATRGSAAMAPTAYGVVASPGRSKGPGGTNSTRGNKRVSERG